MNKERQLMKHEAIEQTVKAVPAVGGAMIASFTLNEVVAIVTIVYVALQSGLLLYKWYWEHKDRQNKKK